MVSKFIFYVLKIAKSGFVSFGRPAPPTGPWRWPDRALALLPRVGIAAAQILQAGLNLQIICDTKFTTKFSRGRCASFVLGKPATGKGREQVLSETISKQDSNV